MRLVVLGAATTSFTTLSATKIERR